jgi:tetratricopeptide (TPR) repeat protein
MGARIWRTVAIGAIVVGLAALAAPGYAQQGQVKGKVVDADNKPVEGAKVTIEATGGMNRKYEVKTNKRGEYIQIGIQPGDYKITAEKDKLTQSFNKHIGLDMVEVNFGLRPGASGDVSEKDRKEAEAKANALKGAFTAGVELSKEGKNDEAIAKFNEVIAAAPKCSECYTNIGAINMVKKDYDAAEAAYKKAIEVNANSVEAYTGLANVYNAQKKFKEAGEASAQARKLSGAAGGATGTGGGASASMVFNQGVIAWNGGNMAEAKKLFQEAVQLDPKLADAQYWLGMATYSEAMGAKEDADRQKRSAEAAPFFEEYLKLAPTGQYAELAKQILATIKK